MATGGENIPSNWEENRLEQREEITALESIYGDVGAFEVVNRAEENDQNSLYTLKLDVAVQLTKESIHIEAWAPYEEECGAAGDGSAQGVTLPAKHSLRRSDSGRRWHSSFSVNHLTPVCLFATMPLSYPSDSAPLFSLSCVWLDHIQLSSLCQQLDALWAENQSMPIIYSWADWLSSNTVKHLGLDTSVVVTPYTSEEVDMGLRDPRAIPECTDIRSSILAMLQHDFAEESRQFAQNIQTCEVCFEEKVGSEFHRLDECLHHFCQECLSQHCELHVTEGTLQQLRCPDNDCDVFLPPYVLRAVLGEEGYQRWERLILQQSLDTMDDIEYCPCCQTVVIRENEEELQLAHCLSCMYSFCTRCKANWHVGEPCPTIEGKLRQIEEASKKRNPGANRKYKLLQLEYMNVRTVQSIAKPCPTCKFDIVKFEGCNKVTCTKCGKHMCWICGQSISGYNHFGKSCELFYVDDNIQNRVPQRQRHQGAVEVERQLREDPGARNRVVRCPRCAQRNLKENRNNHLRCWCCKSNFCYQCKAAITGLITSHFTAGLPCKQHSD